MLVRGYFGGYIKGMQKTIIGFLGDGQLAKMSAEAAVNLGFKVSFLGENSQGPCSGLGEFHLGSIHSAKDVAAFADKAEIVTLENEFIPLDVLAEVGDKLLPSLKSFEKIENKIEEKKTAQALGLPVGKFQSFVYWDEFSFSEPCILKLSKGGYDGYGNFLLRNPDDFEKLKSKGVQGAFIVEELIPFDREVAITLARSVHSEIAMYPVVDTLQENHMCSRVMAPSTLDSETAKTIADLARNFVEGIEYVGVMSLEFFVMKNGEIFFNESAPRPHNSAHYTMDACPASQFENHIRAITGMALGDVSMLAPQAVMLNVLGAHNGAANPQGFEQFEKAKLHLYNKAQSRVGRKMGHVNLLGEERETLLELSDKIEKETSI